MPIRYQVGDATQPVGDGRKIIVHICNDIGAWGAGFVLALSRRWPEPEQAYRWFKSWPLGCIDLVDVEPDITVANLIGQEGCAAKGGSPPIRYDAVRKGLRTVGIVARAQVRSIHMPRIGCGLAGGSWLKIVPIIHDELADLDVTVYDLPPR